ncbi:MarR family winged helix-turn-helix transcriptional regulator [Chloroflexota bacterium]
MQISHDATNSGELQPQPHAGQATGIIEELRDIFARVSSPPGDELLSLISRLESTRSKDKLPPVSKLVSFHRMRRILYRNPGSTMGELSQALSVPLYSVTRAIDSLVAIGLVDRQSDPDDRRVVRVTLTEDGLRLHHAIEDHFARNLERIMACLTPGEQVIMVDLLRKVALSLRESEGEKSVKDRL